jgi:hypothetical protein
LACNLPAPPSARSSRRCCGCCWTRSKPIERWAEKEATKAEVKTFINEWLWSDQRGLPLSYSQPEVAVRSERVFAFVFAHYGGQRAAVGT